VKDWTELLPGSWQRNPVVSLVLAPARAVSRAVSTRDKYELGVLEIDDAQVGLQVIHPQLATYIAHVDIFKAHKIPMADREYVGPLVDLPQHLLLDEENVPLLFLRDAYWRPYLNLRRYCAQMTKKNGSS